MTCVLCLCRFDFGVLTFLLSYFEFLVMCSVYDVVHSKQRNSRGRAKI